MNKTKIEYADYTFNPITGCLHGCEYCYARKIANRFGGASETHNNESVGEECQWVLESNGTNHVYEVQEVDPDRGRKALYPYYFDPTFHRYRLNEPAKIKKPQTIFVCSMADLFGDWVPDEWIQEVFAACEEAPQHRYLFLTKNPKRYRILQSGGMLPHEHWYGTTVTSAKGEYFSHSEYHTFISAEPLFCQVDIDKLPQQVFPEWVIIGAETGNRKGKIIPEKAWIEKIVNDCMDYNVPVFMKDSLIPIIGEQNMFRQFQWAK